MGHVTASDPASSGRRRVRSSRRSRSRAVAGRKARARRVRLFYFALAAVWGFLMGGAAFAVAESLEGNTVRLASSHIAMAAGGLALAGVGAALAAAAYRQSRRR